MRDFHTGHVARLAHFHFEAVLAHVFGPTAATTAVGVLMHGNRSAGRSLPQTIRCKGQRQKYFLHVSAQFISGRAWHAAISYLLEAVVMSFVMHIARFNAFRSEEHTSELQSREN